MLIAGDGTCRLMPTDAVLLPSHECADSVACIHPPFCHTSMLAVLSGQYGNTYTQDSAAQHAIARADFSRSHQHGSQAFVLGAVCCCDSKSARLRDPRVTGLAN